MGIFDHQFHNQRPYWLQFIFDGRMFSNFHTFTVPGSTTLDILQIKTHSPRIIHQFSMFYATQGGGEYIVDLIENPTLTDGTLIDPSRNLDRRSSKTSQLEMFENPTNVSGGTFIDEDFVPAEGGPQSSATISVVNVERIMKKDADYVIRVQNTSTNDGEFHIDMVHYETSN